MTDNQSPTIFIIDDDISVRQGLLRILNVSGYHVEAFSSAKDFLDSNNNKGPGCILLDVKMPGLGGLELQDALIKADCQVPIIFISGHGDVPMTANVMKKGAVDFLTKPIDHKTLLRSVESALEKGQVARKHHEELKKIQARLDKLTPREFEVMTYVIAGLLNKQIAFELGITEDTIKIHRGRMMSKMEVGSVAELVLLVNKAGIEPAGLESG